FFIRFLSINDEASLGHTRFDLFPFEKSTAVYLRATVKQADLAWSRAFITVFVMAKELAARCFATKPKRTTSSCRTSSWFTVKTFHLMPARVNWSRYLAQEWGFHYSFDCKHGPDRKKVFKSKLENAKNKNEDHDCPKRRFLPQNTVKFDCPAQIRLSEVIIYPDYKISDDRERSRRDMSMKLKSDIAKGDKPAYERRIYIQLPKEDQHKDHAIGEVSGILQPIDKLLTKKIELLVGEGVKTVDEMKRHLKSYVKNENWNGDVNITPQNEIHMRYYPTDMDIINCMYRASVKFILSKIDQENLEKNIDVWRERYPEDCFFFRPCTVSPENPASEGDGEVEADITQNLLFIHQTTWQKRLLARYGNEITLLDATYKTMRYELPLFFIVVKTNVNYLVVGSFIIQRETTASIEEALGILKCWNHSWEPKYFMTDFCHEEINAIENTFTDTTTYICDFYIEQCWERWLRKTDNGLSKSREEVLLLLRNVAKSTTENEFEENVKLLKTQDVWLTSPKLRKWFENTWLVETKTDHCESPTTHMSLYHGYGSLIRRELFSFLYCRYLELNTRCSDQYRRYNTNVPKYLHNKPRQLLENCMKRITSAEEFQLCDIKKVDNQCGVFEIKAQSKDRWYNLSFGSGDIMPNCECLDFGRNGLPCKHFFAVPSLLFSCPLNEEHTVEKKEEVTTKEKLHTTTRDNDYIIPDTIAMETSLNLETFAQFACPYDQSHFTNISQLTENKFSEESVVSTNLSVESPPYITIDENSPDPVVWTSIENSYDTGDEVPLVLYSTTKPRLLDKHTWLNNTEICAGQALLKNKFPKIDGLRDPTKYCLEVAPAKSPFIQLLNTGGHWVCCTTISTKLNSGTVRVLDSLYNRPSSHVVEHSCCLLRHSGCTMTFLNEKVQKQIGVSECGLFALAFATDLCYGFDPANQHYDQTIMRQHYVNCLESKAMVPFPKTTKRVSCHATCIKTQVDIFCICRQPDDHKQYVQCFRCQEWYHPTCAGIPTTVINSKKRWRCRKYIKFIKAKTA
ncbi:Calcium-responsive transcription factor, partial [Paramuricea clavata]